MTERQVKKIIRDSWGNSQQFLPDGEKWYPEARDFSEELAKKFSLDIVQTCAIIAILSPLKSWPENKRLAEQFLKGKKWGHFKCQIEKAKKVLLETDVDRLMEIVRGQKSSNFFRNIYNPLDNQWVTVDRHILKLCGKGREIRTTSKRYRIIANSIKNLAKDVNLPATTVQATLWGYSKSLYGINV